MQTLHQCEEAVPLQACGDQERLRCFRRNKGPWSNLDGKTAFGPDVPERNPEGAEFYPSDLTRAEFETWTWTLVPDVKEQVAGNRTILWR